MKPLSPKQSEALRLIAERRVYPDLVREDDGWHARWRALDEEDNPWIDAYMREAAMTPLSADAEDHEHETLHDAWLLALRSHTGLVRWDDQACAAFAEEVRAWNGGARDDVEARRAIVVELELADEPRLRVRKVPHTRRGLRALGQSAFIVPALRNLQATDEGLAVTLSQAEAESFLRVGAKDLQESGFTVNGCDLSAAIQAEVDLSSPSNPTTNSNPSNAANPSTPSLRLTIRVAGEIVSAEEVRFLLEQKSTLVFFRDHWIEVDRNILKEALRALEKNETRQLSVNEAVGFASGIGAIGRMEIAEARAHGWLRGLVNELRRAMMERQGKPTAEVPGVPSRRGALSATTIPLRPYQRRGVAWIKFLTDHGFGALLADDMGLGKTVQTIAWMQMLSLSNGRDARSTPPQTLQPPSSSPALIIAPLTLVSNWRHEFSKFAPDLRVYVHQGEGRQLETGFRRAAAAHDVVVTSYSLLVRDYSILRKVAWSALVLDEAQVIKNPDTQVARAVRALGVRRRLALTGTPVENSVADIWSLEEFLNPSFLGDRKSFIERFVKPIALDERSVAAKKLRHALEPFVLRRVKSDPEIAGELGEKREIREYCALAPAQRAAYEQALADYRASERRQGDVFALITHLKLICDGLTDGERLAGGKVERLVDLLQAIFEAGESALVFTQYAKVGLQIRSALRTRFGRTFPFLHGGLSARQREEAIEAFSGEGPSAFILSLKAGGYGLNLTKATHVIHFDRWWNPAVEAQATDRAHRIGQTQTVFVHSFITEGTLEERVDEILERKSRIAGTLVTNGESFLLSLGDDELGKIIDLT